MAQPLIEGYRLSPAQQRLWRQHGDRIGPYRVCARVTIAGPIDPVRLRDRLRRVGLRQEILRTTYTGPAGSAEPLQLVQDEMAPAFEIEDLTGVERSAQAARIDARIQELSEREVDLERGPVWHAYLLIRSVREAELLLMWPSHVADASSVDLILRDCASEASDPVLQHVDVSEWQHQVSEAEGTAAARQVWRDLSIEAIVNTRLPLRRHLTPARERLFRPKTLASAVPADVVADADVLLVCWLLLMSRLTMETTIGVGIDSHGRGLRDLASVVGPLTRTLPVRVEIDRRMPVAQFITLAREVWHRQRRWHELFSWDLMQGAGTRASDAFCPLAFAIIDTDPVVAIDDLRCGTVSIEACVDRFELKLSIVRTPDGWQENWAYDPIVHEVDQVAVIAEQYVAVVRAAVRNMSQAIGDLDVRGARERTQVLVDWNATGECWPRETGDTLTAWVERYADATPDAMAVWAETGQWTYARLHADANQLARHLRRLGVGPEARVGVWIERGPHLVIALLAVLKAGGAYVPLDPRYPPARLAFQLTDAQVRVVLTDRACAAHVPAGDYAVEVLDDREAAWRAESSEPLSSLNTPDHLAYIIYTSGSTGEPKGAMNTHAGVLNRLAWMQATYRLASGDRVLQKTSISFDVSVWELFWPIGAGATLVLAKPDGQRDPDYLADLIARSGVSVSHFVPSMLEAFVASGGLASCAGLRLLVCSGEALPGALARRVHAAWPGRLENLYGPTEAAVDVTWHASASVDREAPIVPIGRPVANTRLFIVDPKETGKPVPIGVTGELCLGGIQVGRGYWQRPALTAASFVPDPFSATPGARLYRTGDLTRYRADGVVEYIGRADQQIKLHGHRIELGEIEAVLRQQPDVREAVAHLREDVPGEPRLVAYVVPAVPGATIAGDDLRQRLCAHLPSASVPAVMVTLPALPLTPNGKVDRRALPAPDETRPTLAVPYVAPRSDTELRLAAIWAEVLRQDRVGIDDDFFALGGDSILSLQIVARAARAGLRLTSSAIFAHHTIAALAPLAEAAAVTTHDQLPVAGDVPLTPIQSAFFAQALVDAHHYNYAVVFDLTQPIAPARLSEVWLRLQQHHDALRLRFARTADGWTQHNADVDASTSLTTIDLGGVPPHDAERWWMRVASSTQRSLHLTRGPLARAVLVQTTAPAPARLLLVVHHLVVDGVSSRVLLEDLHELCTQARVQPDRERWSLPAKTLSFRQWSTQLATRAQQGDYDRDQSFWEEMSQPGASLPRDAVTGPNDVASERIWRGALRSDETEQLLQRLPAALGVHVQEALVAALVHALAEWTGASDWRIDLEGHGRDAGGDRDDVSRTVGWFTAIYPVRVAWMERAEPVQALRAARSVLRRVPGSGASYGVLRYLRHRVAGTSAAELLFNYWGLIDQVVVSSAQMRPTRAAVGPLRAAGQARAHLLEISASVLDGRLHVQWTFSDNVHRVETIEQVATRMLDTLRQLIALPMELRAWLQTPADFPFARLSDSELHALTARHGAMAGIFPLSPLQEGLLFHQIAGSDRSVYVQQCHARLEGPLDAAAFRAAWESTVARHDTLRTAFLWERRDGLLQVIQESAALPWRFEDWRGLDRDTQQSRLSALLAADLRDGFALECPPLMRITVLRRADEEWEVVWTSHHLALDGWSLQIVLRDVFSAYVALTGERRHEPSLASGSASGSRRYADYITWLQAQDPSRTEAFWRGTLSGLRAPCLLAPRASTASPPRSASASASRAVVASSTIEGLRHLGQRERVTMSSWLTGTWALLLGFCTKCDDVVTGMVVSGRPPHVPGIETMAGLFANTLPLRLRIARDEPALAFFAACQQRQVDATAYEHTSLARAQGWSDLPPGTPLFDTVLAYQNYPTASIWSEKSDLRVAGLRTTLPTTYPLTIDVADMPHAVSVEVTYDERQVDRALAAFVRDGFEVVLSHLVAAPSCTVGALLAVVDARAGQIRAQGSHRRRDSRRDALRAMQTQAAAS